MELLKTFAIIVCLLAQNSVCNKEEEFNQFNTVLNFSGQGLATIPQSFEDYVNLIEINLSNNDIQEFAPTAFENNRKLKRLDISHNPRFALPAIGAFLISETLESINLSNCHIERVPGNALDGLTNLYELDLTENPIVFEESLAFANLTHPPRHLIISKIEADDLAFICRWNDMTVSIIDERIKVDCKTIRNKRNLAAGEEERITNGEYENDATMDNETTWIEIESGQFLPYDSKRTHEEEMQSDQGIIEEEDGSGDEGGVEEDQVDKQLEEATTMISTITEKDAINTTIEEEEDINGEEGNDDQFIAMPPINETDSNEENEQTAQTTTTIMDDEDEKETKVDLELYPTSIGRSFLPPPPPPSEPVLDITKEDAAATTNEHLEEHVNEKKVARKDFNDADVEVLKENYIIQSKDNNDKNVEETATTTSASQNIILIVIIAIVAVGGALGGYRYYDHHRKTNCAPATATIYELAETTDRELDEIRVLRPESKPLMYGEVMDEVDFETKEVVDGGEEYVPAKDALMNRTNKIPSIDIEKRLSMIDNDKK